MNSTETAVYNNYRAVLRKVTSSARAHGDRNTRMATCRQHARQLTAERYNLSYRELKDIIARHDEQNGISHIPDPRTQEQKDFYQFQMENEQVHACPGCGGRNQVASRQNPQVFEPDGEDASPFIHSCLNCFERLSGA